MKIIIICNPDVIEPEKTTFEYFKEKCRDSLRSFSIEVEGTDLKYKSEKSQETEETNKNSEEKNRIQDKLKK